MTASDLVISCRNVWKVFGDHPDRLRLTPATTLDELRATDHIAAVRDVSLDIRRGEMLVVMGLSGSGKSTLVRCLARLLDITAGTVEVVEGRDIGRLSETELIDLRRKKMGMVFQSFGLLPHRTALENVAFPLEMRGQDRASRIARAREMLALVGLKGREGYFPRELSGGQQQRVGIARSLAVEPDIWFLDEPFSALDPLIRREMQDEFLRLKGMLAKTIVFITHDFDEALRLADRIAIMKDGAVEQIDTPERIVMAPATPYVAKFTEAIDRTRVVHALALAQPVAGRTIEGEPLPANETLHALARRIVGDSRALIPLVEKGQIAGLLDRKAALDLLLAGGMMAATLPQLPYRPDQKRIAQAILLVALALVLSRNVLPAGLLRLPESLVLPFAAWINAAFDFARDDLGLMAFTRAFSDMVEVCLDVTANLLYGKSRWPHVGPIPWVVIAATAGMAGYALGGLRLALLAAGTFVWIAVMGQWKWAMETLSVIVVAVPFSVVLGLLMGILAWRSRLAERILNPILNIAQSLPHFAYMIPVVVFIGVGPKAGAIVTIIFSVPPMIRMSLLGLRAVSPEIIESGKMSGTTRWQLMTRVRLPAARTEILIGVNQVIMQSLAMVVLASFIGMPGLGQKLLQLLQALKIGLSVEIGITIVLLAIVLDRMSKAWAMKQPEHVEGATWLQRHRLLAIWLGLVALGFLAAWAHPYFVEVERKQALSMAGPVDAVVGGFIDLIDPVTDWLRWFLITWVLIPLRDAFLWLPTSAVLLALAGIGWRIGGWRSALVCLAFALPIALSGWWDRAMITAYTVFVSVTLALFIGVPLGLLGAANETRAQRFLLVCDTAQTFPSFIYLIPVIMLFGVNDVAVIAAVMVFATVPIVRYTIEGLRSIPPEIVEAAQMSGASTGQLLRHVKLPLAVPTLVVGANQSIMFALFMVIIAAFIGTQDLGQEMQRALSSTDVGKGLVLGLAVAFMGLMADHLLLKWARNQGVSQGTI